MKNAVKSFVRRAFKDERGQVLPWIAMGMVSMLGMGGLSIDVGSAYVVHAQLQNYANAAALAAAGVVYNTSTVTNATSVATTYSGGSGDKNANPAVGTITTTVRTLCLSSLNAQHAACPSSNPPPNAVRVVETASLKTTFMKMFGIPKLNVTATATSSMQGQSQPWNVAIILDATGSMSTTDSNCGSVTEFQCALNGIQGMLAAVNPCKAGATTCTNANANFHVALFGFPGVSTSTVSYENACSSYSTPTFQMYALPKETATSYAPFMYKQTSNNNNTFTQTYEVTYGASDADANGFVSNYYDSTQSNGLNSSSSIVKAITKCMQPISSPGSGTGGLQGAYTGGITYYASVLYAAQSALKAEQSLYSGTNNAIIFLSDGQANLVSSTGDFPTAFTASPTSAGYNTLTATGYYPSAKDECQQAIIAAQTATNAGTQVFSVAYGSQQTGCSSGSGATDVDTLTLPLTANASFTGTTLTPCVTMENIASSLNNFYSDYLQSGSGSTCQDASHTVTSLNGIFMSIAASFTQPRLIPNDAT